jgi:hypothetical protein
MKTFLFLLVTSILLITNSKAQTFLHGTVGIQGERVTNCLTSTCTGNYFDSGGNAGNYTNNITGGLYRVFCPTIPGNCMRVTFNRFSTEATFDFLTIGNGATQNAPVFTNPPALNPSGRISGNPAVPFTYTANNPSGCLTFRFTSDFSVISSGWAASLSCIPCATLGNGPNLIDNNDCSRATPLCSGTSLNLNARGPGLVAEGCTGNTCPAGGENHTNWYTFTVATSGTLTMLIDPQTNTDDYDFAIYGPNTTCNTLGVPIRCTDSGNTGNTGLNTTAVDNIESVTGDAFLAQMNVIAGQTYTLVVDEWLSNTGNGYALSFGGTATLDCDPLLELKLLNFSAEYRNDHKDVIVFWSTLSEYSNNFFIIEKSIDGITFDSIGTTPSQGNTQRADYTFIDNSIIPNGMSYYRLKWYEEGVITYSDISAIAVNDPTLNGIVIYPNPTNNIVNIQNFNGNLKCHLKIYNSLGQIIYQRNNLFMISTLEQVIMRQLPAGTYSFEISSDSFRKSYLIVKY